MMSLNDTWNSQYDDGTKTALKDNNLYEIETVSILSYLSDYIRENAFPGGLNIIELGCGTGELIQRVDADVISKHIEEYTLTGIDFSSTAVKIARKKTIPRASFVESDFSEYISNVPSNSVDMIITQRSIMALMEKDEQEELLGQINRVLTISGQCVFSECFIDDFNRFNDLRLAANLEPISKVWHSRYLDESMLERIYNNVSYDHFCSTYMLVTRLIYPMFENPKHNQPIHLLASALPNSGETSFLKIAVAKKRN